MTARRTKKPGSTLEAEVHRLRAQLKQRRVEAKSERELAERRGELAQELREELDSILLHHKKSEREIAALKSALQDARARAADSRQTAHLAEFQNAQSGDALPHMQALDDLVHRRTDEWQRACKQAEARVRQLEAAVREVGSVLALSDPEGRRMRAIHAPEDSEIEALCERVGYGAVMDSAARLWRKKGGNGAFTTGACVGTVIATLETLDRVLGQKIDRPATETGRIVRVKP